MFLSYSLHVSIVGFFLLFAKNGFVVGVHSLKVTASTLAAAMNTPLSQCHASLGATQYSAACQTHIRCTLNWTGQAGKEAEKERGRMEDGREGAMEHE